MAIPTTWQGDIVFVGNVTFQGQNNLKALSVNDAQISSTPNGTHGIDTDKLEARETYNYSQTGNAVAATLYIGPIVGTSGELDYIGAALLENIPSGDRTVTIDVQRSTGAGAFASVLTAPIVLDSANVLRTVETGTFTAATLAAGDYLKITVAVAGSTGSQPQGLTIRLRWEEDPI